jgi:hypothetical protein
VVERLILISGEPFMKLHSLPSLDAAIAELSDVSTEGLITITSMVNKIAKTPDAGDQFTRLNYLWKDAAISIMLTARPECVIVLSGTRPDGGVAMTISTSSRRTDVHCYPWHLSARAKAMVRRKTSPLPMVSPLLAERLAAALVA